LGVVYAFWEPFVAWGTIMLLLERFQRHFASLNSFWRPLARRSYAIYVVHPPVLVAVALAWSDVPAYPLLKFAVTGSVTCALCFLVTGWLLRVPGVRTVL
jgi:peptidoglycan/LPS O-acetylase OafA/YrhL